MKISPSIASSLDLLNLEKEICFIDKYFDSIHLDIEDGVAVNNISFGFKFAKAICEKSISKEKTIHLEVMNPSRYIETIKNIKADIIFVQIDALENPIEEIIKFKENNINVGINVSNLDLNREYLSKILELSHNILVNTTHHDDLKQICDPEMIEFAKKLSETKKVWIDGGVTWEIYNSLKESVIYEAIMGRAIFFNKDETVKWMLDAG